MSGDPDVSTFVMACSLWFECNTTQHRRKLEPAGADCYGPRL